MDYQLIACGDLYKIERFGPFTIARPEPQALWSLSEPLDIWKDRVDAFYERKKTDVISNKEDSGDWRFNKSLPDNWIIKIGDYGAKQIKAKLAFTSFKHVGIFPEQKDNWDFIASQAEKISGEKTLLNLFAYTGIASLVSSCTGYKTTHVDAVKQVINWANENRELSRLEPTISWVVEDTMKFIKREISRNKKYNAIILDPPAYGRGPKGEKWVLEKEIYELLSLCKQLLAPQNSFLIINLYSLNMSPYLLENLLREAGIWTDQSYTMEQFIPYQENKKLPLGVCARVIY